MMRDRMVKYLRNLMHFLRYTTNESEKLYHLGSNLVILGAAGIAFGSTIISILDLSIVNTYVLFINTSFLVTIFVTFWQKEKELITSLDTSLDENSYESGMYSHKMRSVYGDLQVVVIMIIVLTIVMISFLGANRIGYCYLVAILNFFMTILSVLENLFEANAYLY